MQDWSLQAGQGSHTSGQIKQESHGTVLSHGTEQPSMVFGESIGGQFSGIIEPLAPNETTQEVPGQPESDI